MSQLISHPPMSDGRPVLDLSVNLGIIPRGDVTVWKTWLRKPGADDGWEPCLVLTPTSIGESFEKITPCVVTQSRAWVYDETVGNDHEAMVQAGIFCANLGFNPFNAKNPIKVLGIIRDLLHELLILPPRPPINQQAAAEMVVTDNATGKTREVEVFDEALD